MHCAYHRIEDEWVADATTRGGCARFINHSCDPNCYTRIFSVEGVSKIGIYAKRNISRGEELAYDYKVRGAGFARRWSDCHSVADT
jgi:SET domain-containing protein